MVIKIILDLLIAVYHRNILMIMEIKIQNLSKKEFREINCLSQMLLAFTFHGKLQTNELHIQQSTEANIRYKCNKS